MEWLPFNLHAMHTGRPVILMARNGKNILSCVAQLSPSGEMMYSDGSGIYGFNVEFSPTHYAKIEFLPEPKVTKADIGRYVITKRGSVIRLNEASDLDAINNNPNEYKFVRVVKEKE